MEISSELASLIRPRKVCLCNEVSQADIARAYKGGAKTLRSIIKETRASTGCGTCLNELAKIIDNLRDDEQEKTNPSLFRRQFRK